MNKIQKWLENEIAFQFSGSSHINSWVGDRHLKHYSENRLLGIANASAWEFTPDFVAVFVFEGSKQIAFMNFTKDTLGLTELGELHVYAKIAEPTLAVQATASGLSKDLYSLLLNQGIQDRLLGYSLDRKILVGHWDESKSAIPQDSFFPPRDI